MRTKSVSICYFHRPHAQGQHTYRLLRPGLSIVLDSGPIRIQVYLRTERAWKQTFKIKLMIMIQVHHWHVYIVFSQKNIMVKITKADIAHR